MTKQSGPHYLETEVKFHVPDIGQMQQRLQQLGAAAQPERFETNVRFENPSGTLKSSDRLLRLRKDATCRLTFKKRPDSQRGQCKTYHELEVEVSDFDTMHAILHALGFKAVQRYDKRRQVFTLRNVEVCVDRMPFGTFVEIEGPEEGIKTAASALGLHWEKRILTNYLAIFELVRSHERLPFNDATFGNFKSFSVDITHFLPQLWAGPSER